MDSNLNQNSMISDHSELSSSSEPTTPKPEGIKPIHLIYYNKQESNYWSNNDRGLPRVRGSEGVPFFDQGKSRCDLRGREIPNREVLPFEPSDHKQAQPGFRRGAHN